MSAKEFLKKFPGEMKKMQAQAGPVSDGFSELFDKVMVDGAISALQKEFIALGIGVSERCETCMILHTQKALAAGASREQIIEAASVAVVMGGGPAWAAIPFVIKILDDLAPV